MGDDGGQAGGGMKRGQREQQEGKQSQLEGKEVWRKGTVRKAGWEETGGATRQIWMIGSYLFFPCWLLAFFFLIVLF